MLDAVAAIRLGVEGLDGADEVGLGEAGADPGAEVLAEGVDVLALVQEVAGEARDGAGDLLRELGEARGVVLGGVDGAVGLLGGAKLLDRLLELCPARVGARRGVGDRLDAGEGGLGGPVDEVQPEGLVVELADAVVAEEVGIREDGDAAIAVLGDRDERGIRRRGGGRCAGDGRGEVPVD